MVLRRRLVSRDTLVSCYDLHTIEVEQCVIGAVDCVDMSETIESVRLARHSLVEERMLSSGSHLGLRFR